MVRNSAAFRVLAALVRVEGREAAVAPCRPLGELGCREDKAALGLDPVDEVVRPRARVRLLLGEAADGGGITAHVVAHPPRAR